MSEFEEVDLHITIVARGQTSGYEGIEDAGEWTVQHDTDTISNWASRGAAPLAGRIITNLMAVISEQSGGYVMPYQCDEHRDRVASAVFTILENGDVSALCGECILPFAMAICTSQGYTVTEAAGPGAGTPVTPIAQGSKGRRGRSGKGAKDTGEPAGESTRPELADRCDAQVTDGCTGRGLPRPDLVDRTLPEAGEAVMCDPCYTQVKSLLTELPGAKVVSVKGTETDIRPQDVNTFQDAEQVWEDEGGAVPEDAGDGQAMADERHAERASEKG